MPDNYPVIQIQPEWALEPEEMGTKEKFWYRKSGDDVDWLFKWPRENTGEHWAEKIAAEVADALGVPHATVELAELEGQRGSASRSFLFGDLELWHGNQMMERTVAGYDPEIQRGQSDHTFENIWTSFGRVFEERQAASRNRTGFAAYLVLDAVIGNTDRHHENWGLLRRRVGGQWQGHLAPSFDHASSLGRELRDEKRALLLRENREGWYSERGRGGIFWGRDAKSGVSPLSVVRRAIEAHPNHFTAVMTRLTELRDSLVAEIVNRIPSNWMSPQARGFATNLISYNRAQLMELVK